MNISKIIHETVFLPIILVIFVLSVENITIWILDFVVSGINNYNDAILLNLQEILEYLILLIARGIGLIIIVKFARNKLGDEKIVKEDSRQLFLFIIASLIVLIGLLSFLISILESFSPLFTLSRRITFWPRLTDTGTMTDNFGILLILAILLLILTPVFEEYLFRKIVISGLRRNALGTGWIVIFSSLIYALPPTLVILVEYGEIQVGWNFLLKVFCGIILALVFLRTKRIRFSILVSSLFNLYFFSYYLVVYHPDFSQYEGLITMLISFLSLIGLLLFFIIIFDGIAASRESDKPLPKWMNDFLDYTFSTESNLRSLFACSVVLIPLIPYGLLLFVDHTVLYTDYSGELVRTVLKLAILVGIILISLKGSLMKEIPLEERTAKNISSKLIFLGYYRELRLNPRNKLLKLVKTPFRHIGVILLIFGAILPLIYVSMKATGTFEVIILWVADTNIEVTFFQSPFLSYIRGLTEFSSIIYFLPVQRVFSEVFYLFKHTNGKWYFLPDTFMSTPSDWIHGIMTAGMWFIFMFLFFFVIREYLRNRKLYAGIGVLGVLISETFWMLLVSGVGAASSQGGPPVAGTNSTLSLLIQTTFEIEEFLFLPIGLLFLGIAFFYLLTSGIRQRRREKKREEEGFASS